MKKIIALSLFSVFLFLESAAIKQVIPNVEAKTLPVQENRVHKAGQFWINVTNTGYFGNPWNQNDPCTGQSAVSGNMPGGSNEQYLFATGLMFGGYLEKQIVNVGASASLFGDPLVTTAYEGWTGLGGSQWMAKELWPIEFSDDPEGTVKGKIIESSDIPGRVNCLLQDVYDPTASANEQFTTWYSDKYIDSALTYYSYTGIDDYDLRFHIPLGVEVKQKTYAWSNPYSKNIIIADYTVYNRNRDGKDIYDFFMGLYNDFDLGTIDGEWMYCHADDIGGFVHKWDKYIDPATGGNKTVNLDLAWTADNDGRNYNGQDWYTATGEPPGGPPFNGTTGVAGLKVLKNPDPEQKYSYNLYTAYSGDESFDWSPRWKDGLHSDWYFDLTTEQKGYDDTNQDSLPNGTSPLYGGRTEGRPIGDKGRYMVMSNGEADYGVLDLREVYLGVYTDPDYLIGTPYAQADKWKPWVMEGGTEFPDGSAYDLNQLANGNDVKYILSFGPLGEKTSVNAAIDTNLDSIPDNYISKEVWKFAYGDSLKFTFAFITGENFNTSLDQDPNYENIDEINLEDGLNKTLYEQGWYDAFNSSIWAERIYDTPLYDTPVTKDGITKGDGWCGEDVGKDGLFAPYGSNGICWWFDEEYLTADEGEGDNELNTFTTPEADIYGWTAANEDLLLPYGHQTDTPLYGEMIRYTDDDGTVPLNSWVRYGFNNGKVDQGDGVPDFKGPSAPPPPAFTVEKTGTEVVLKWSSHQLNSEGDYQKIGPEHSTDNFSRLNDFEGYKIMISSDGNFGSFISLFSADKVNYSYQNVADPTEYLNNPIETDDPDTLMQTVYSGGKIWQLVPFMLNNSLDSDFTSEGNFHFDVETDTSQSVTAGVVRNYTFSINANMLGSRDFVTVASMDYGDPKYGVKPQTSEPTLNAVMLSNIVKAPSQDPQIVPNPIRGDRLYTSDEWSNVIDPSYWGEGKLLSVFTNLPENCVIRVFTLSGDLVKTIGHNGSDTDAEHKYKEVWNLKNDNGDIISSGIYMFSVQDADENKDDFVGKFVVVR